MRTTKDRLLRALAETENLRRRSAREVEEARKYAITGFARELLEVADNLSRALDSIRRVRATRSSFVKTLADGVGDDREGAAAPASSATRSPRSRPRSARGSITTATRRCSRSRADQPPGTVAQVLQPGYVIADRLLRPALVGVAKAPAAQAPGPTRWRSDAPEAGADRRTGRASGRHLA